MRTDRAVSWYSWTRATICTRGDTTRPESIWKAISAPNDQPPATLWSTIPGRDPTIASSPWPNSVRGRTSGTAFAADAVSVLPLQFSVTGLAAEAVVVAML